MDLHIMLLLFLISNIIKEIVSPKVTQKKNRSHYKPYEKLDSRFESDNQTTVEVYRTPNMRRDWEYIIDRLGLRINDLYKFYSEICEVINQTEKNENTTADEKHLENIRKLNLDFPNALSRLSEEYHNRSSLLSLEYSLNLRIISMKFAKMRENQERALDWKINELAEEIQLAKDDYIKKHNIIRISNQKSVEDRANEIRREISTRMKIDANKDELKRTAEDLYRILKDFAPLYNPEFEDIDREGIRQLLKAAIWKIAVNAIYKDSSNDDLGDHYCGLARYLEYFVYECMVYRAAFSLLTAEEKDIIYKEIIYFNV